MITAIIAASLAAATPSVGAPPACTPRVETLTVTLGGAASRAEILRPPHGRPRAIMVLIHGSDVADLDNSIVGADDRIVSTPLKDVAQAMACGGIATIRYDKRFVSGPSKVDRTAFEKADLKDFLADAAIVLDTAKHRPDLQKLPELVFGWSEGTTVAAALAARRPSVRGVVLQAPVLVSFAKSLQRDYPRVGAPYMLRYATEGALDAAAVARAAAGPGGVITQIYVKMFKGFAPNDTLNGLLDSNHDGRIDIAREATPVIKGWFADGPDGGLSIYATGVALPGVRSQLAAIKAPVLVLQGEADGAMDADDARDLRDAALPGVTVRLYPGLGHSLGVSASPLEDRFLPIQPAPLADMVTWTVAALR